MVFSKPCGPCGGSGQVRSTVCTTCAGVQVEVRTEPLTIATPAGLADGARVRVAAMGHAGRSGGEPGVSTSRCMSSRNPLFRREGDDLHLVVPVAIHEAALGTRFEVPSLEGLARVRVPPGTQSGQRFRLRERGRGRRSATAVRGDLVHRGAGRAPRRCSMNDRRSSCASSAASTVRM